MAAFNSARNGGPGDSQEYDFLFKIVLIGDSHLDYLAAQSCEFEFIFLSNYAEMDDWENFCSKKNIDHFPDLSSLINYF